MATMAALVRAVYPRKEPDDIAAIRVLGWWHKAVSERVYRRARPVLYRAGVLYVNTATTAWAQELDYAREDLIASLRKAAPEVRIKEIRFRVGVLPNLPPPIRPEPKQEPAEPLTDLPETLARALTSIDDDTLRDVVARAASMSLGRQAGR